jgi:hypothetical protein
MPRRDAASAHSAAGPPVTSASATAGRLQGMATNVTARCDQVDIKSTHCPNPIRTRSGFQLQRPDAAGGGASPSSEIRLESPSYRDLGRFCVVGTPCSRAAVHSEGVCQAQFRVMRATEFVIKYACDVTFISIKFTCPLDMDATSVTNVVHRSHRLQRREV